MFNFVKLTFFIAIACCNSLYSVQDQVLPITDFGESMLCVAKYTFAGARLDLTLDNITDWQTFAVLYNQHIRDGKHDEECVRIPRIIHHIWLGSPLPDRCRWFINTWQQHNPDWVFILWDDEAVAQLGLVNQKAYDAATNWGEKSDIARYEILYRYGGLYVDTDFECLQPFDALHRRCDFYTGAYANIGTEPCYVFNGLMASIPEHPVLERCIEGILHQTSRSSDAYYNDIINRTGPAHLTRCLKEAIAQGDDIGICVAFPATYFYPWPGVWRFTRERGFIEQFIRPESLAIHHWASSWV